jgi:hypothetical protein
MWVNWIEFAFKDASAFVVHEVFENHVPNLGDLFRGAHNSD